MLAWHLDKLSSPPTAATWIQDQVDEVIESIAIQKRSADQQSIMQAYNAMASGQQDAFFSMVQALLGEEGGSIMTAWYALDEAAQEKFLADVKTLLNLE
jgi:hypothetical protein